LSKLLKKTHMGQAVGKSHFIFVGIFKWGWNENCKSICQKQDLIVQEWCDPLDLIEFRW
jgi:hypothetical protein